MALDYDIYTSACLQLYRLYSRSYETLRLSGVGYYSQQRPTKRPTEVATRAPSRLPTSLS